MQARFLLLTFLGLTVALFALQNAGPVTVRFLHWQLNSSLAVVTLAAAAVGAVTAWLLGLTTRVMRWSRSGSSREAPPAPPPGA